MYAGLVLCVALCNDMRAVPPPEAAAAADTNAGGAAPCCRRPADAIGRVGRGWEEMQYQETALGTLKPRQGQGVLGFK